ncbi:ROK family transcriptional regulator [Streptomyces griseorubiginosus]|uniref:ROK family transcriptional regulator n=1 Tax=Streptomyces griseorubiginosus TaxID=67304 RepID=UPI0036A1BF14
MGEARKVGEVRAAADAGVNLPALRSHNTALVLDLLRRAGVEGISRLELAERTGLTPQAVSKITGRLRDAGLAAEAGRRASTGGKPRTVLRLVPEAGHAVGVHLDRDALRLVLVNLAGTVVGERYTDVDLGAGAEAVVAAVAGEVEALVDGWARGGGGRSGTDADADADAVAAGPGADAARPGTDAMAARHGADAVTAGPGADAVVAGPGADADVSGRTGWTPVNSPTVWDRSTPSRRTDPAPEAAPPTYPAPPPGATAGSPLPPPGVAAGPPAQAPGATPAPPTAATPFPPPPLLGVGVALPGPLDHTRGVLHRVTGFAEWDGFPLRDALGERLGVPVAVDKDTNAAALGLAVAGERGSFAYLHLGTGLGAGLVIDGVVRRGARTAAGEFGHQVVQLDGPPCDCGDRGCVEALCLTAVSRGDLAEAARVLGIAAGNLVALLDIDLVLLGGRTVTGAPEMFLRGVGAVLDERARRAGEPPVPVRTVPGDIAEGAAQLVLAPLFGRADA